MKWYQFSAGAGFAMSLATFMTYYNLWERLGGWGSFAYCLGLLILMAT